MKTVSGRQAKYTLNVGNIGNMAYSNKREALKEFAFYKECSINLCGRACSESVYLYNQHGECLAEYTSTIDNNEEE